MIGYQEMIVATCYQFCLNNVDTEDGFHFILKCECFADIRRQCIKYYY